MQNKESEQNQQYIAAEHANSSTLKSVPLSQTFKIPDQAQDCVNASFPANIQQLNGK